MISDLLFKRMTIPDMESALNAYSARQKAISSNIANVNTPCYQAKKISFEDEYCKCLKGCSLYGEETHENHFEIGQKDLTDIKPHLDLRSDTLNDSGINNVDIDREMAELAKNNIRFEMITKLIGKKFTNLKAAIKGR
ncbi:MAG: flagellar basal body rod protein FlgB [Candidatus Cloacimonetes bacterium]|nr:flagellar basal body rod protein FlgB [Candidatus Cloacimonadota bacterium]